MNKSFKIGDQIAVLDDTIKGKVVKVNEELITIEANDGFLLEYYASELVLVKMNQNEFSKFIDVKQDIILEKESSGKKITSIKRKKNREQPPLEVDLHIHQLVKNTKRMTNYDMLTLQIDTTKRQLEFAIRKKIQRIVFIHGVGQGVLQKELEYLLGRYNVEVRQASFQKYGMGATEVYIYQNQ